MTDQELRLDAATLRVLAHPMRLTLLRHLRQHGPATARQLAAQYAIDSGAASYHLRRLGEGGLIEEDVERGNRRDRWWRARTAVSVHHPSGAEDDRAYVRAAVLAYSDQLRRVADDVALLSDEWLAASTFSDYTLRLKPAGLEEVKRELKAVLDRHRSDDGTPISVQLQAFPVQEPANGA
ncbi:ArsR family transcriptional regulator [Kribbella capetownensis]|uniref:ArsR family transcriptional regulator n=1 Tax=Kribbella capetownensis TaxID=1572659 RepID=A0A4R0K4M3_9ACTN|nr:helix-turn-helix domain-containing protein [Kribbella capetownensis]TCC49905.1 ArsR family transcriptional regulator [Kribbella capetownensis]